MVEHDLQVNAWVMAYRELVGDQVIDWLGPEQGRIDVPTTYDPHRRFRPIDLEDASITKMTDYADPATCSSRLRAARAGRDARRSTRTRSASELDLLIELDRTRRPTKNVDKLHRYDAFLTAWYRVTDRYRRVRSLLPWCSSARGERDARA